MYTFSQSLRPSRIPRDPWWASGGITLFLLHQPGAVAVLRRIRIASLLLRFTPQSSSRHHDGQGVLAHRTEPPFSNPLYRPHPAGQGITKSKAQKPFPKQHTLMCQLFIPGTLLGKILRGDYPSSPEPSRQSYAARLFLVMHS